MTQQEKIREGIEQSICSNCDDVSDWIEGQTLEDAQKYCRERAICAYCTDLTNDILQKQDAQGVVIKVERELPLMFGTVESYARGLKKMREAGYEAVENLIEEVNK